MARKVNLYVGCLEKEKKLKFGLKRAVATFCLATSFMCTLAGCGRKNDFGFDRPNKVTTSYENTNKTTNQSNSTFIGGEVYKAPEIQYSALSFNNIKYTTDSNNYFQNYLSTLNVKYDYSELFNTEKALELYEEENKAEVKHTHDFLNGGKTVDADKLYDVVIDNNKDYLSKNKSSLYKELSKKELKKILVIVADTINEYVKEHPDIDLNSLSCTLGDLKVFSKTAAVNAFVSEDGVLAINPPMLNILVKKYETKGIDAYENTIKHETIHLIQRMCQDEREQVKSKFIGISRKYESLDMNPLCFNWLYESSAEKNVSNMKGDIPIVYSTMITYLNSLNLTNFLNDDNTTTEAENLDSYKKLEGLFKLFGASTYEEKIELINMMVSINIIQAEPEDFIKKYEKAYGKEFSEESVFTEVKCIIKAEVMQTLTKYFYKNLANKIANKELAIEDIFYLITIFENDINLHIKYTNSKYNDYNENFINYYVNVQNEFFYSISLNGTYTFEEIQGKFDLYNVKAYDEANNLQNNYSLVWLDEEKVCYVQSYEGEVLSNNHESIQNNLKRVYGVNKQLVK